MKKEVSRTKHVQKLFLTGLLVILPVGLTCFIVVWLFNTFDNLLGRFIQNWIGFRIPGLGIILTLALIFLVGLIVSNVVGKKLNHLVEKLFSSIPLVKTIYTPIRDMIRNFSGEGKQALQRVVMVEFPDKQTKSLGFVINDAVQVNNKQMVSVFVPTTPNPTNGFLMFAESAALEDVDMEVDDAIKLIVSMGSIIPDAWKPAVLPPEGVSDMN